MWKDGWNPSSKNTVPLQIPTTLIKARKDREITDDLDENLQAEMLIPENQEDNSSDASQLLRQGIQYQQAGELPAAMKSLQESLALFQAFGNPQRQAQALSCLALVAYTSGDYKSAISYANQCLPIAKDVSDLRVQIQALSHMGNAFRHLGDFDSSIEYLQECLKLAKQLQDKRSQVAALNNLGLVYKALNNLPRAIQLKEQSLELVQ